MKKRIICLAGPTAVGKTALSLELARRLPIEIISVDSVYVYKDMDIGTSKPTLDEISEVPHHLIDICEPSDTYSAARFVHDATKLIHEIHSRNKLPVLVGGTMLYFKSLIQGIAPLPGADIHLRNSLTSEAEIIGWPKMHAKLAALDPVSADKIKPTDPQRIQRALEVYHLTGKPLSAHFEQQLTKPSFEGICVGIVPPDRSILHKQIELRFKLMLEQGLLAEVATLQQKYNLASQTAGRSVGYKQALEYLAGKLTRDTMEQKAIIATRQLAKRQLTWLRSWPNLKQLQSNASVNLDNLLKLATASLAHNNN